MCALKQPHRRALLTESRIVAVHIRAGQQEVDCGSVLPEYSGCPEKIRMIFHRVIASDQPDQERVWRQTELGTNLRSGSFRRLEFFQLEPIGDDRPSMLIESKTPLVNFRAHHRVGDYSRGQCGKPGAHPDRRRCHEFFPAHKVIRASDIPCHGGRLRQGEGRRLGSQVAVIHPTLQQVRRKAAQQARQVERRSKAGEAGLHAAIENRYVKLRDAAGQRTFMGERNH